MSDSQWVVSKYAPATGERWEVNELEDAHTWFGKIPGEKTYNLRLPKSEYVLTNPPERWETVPHCYWKINSARDQAWLHCGIMSHEEETQRGPLALQILSSIYRFDIQDGRLVLQRRVTG